MRSLEILLSELRRVLREEGKISIIFKHMDLWHYTFKKVEIQINEFFKLERKIKLTHIHWDKLEKDFVYIFKKNSQ